MALGLGAALSWGLADYFAAVASRGIGALRVVLGFHLFALVPLTVLVLATGDLAHVTAHQLVFFVGIGAVGWVSYLAFYGALAIGPISVLSPIVSGYAAITVLLAVVIAGDTLSGAQSAAVGITIVGAMLASADVRAIVHTKLRRRSVLGFVLALCAMALLGGFVFGVSYYRAQIGWLAPIFLARGFATVFLLAHVLAGGRAEPAASDENEMPEIDVITAGAGPLAAGAVSVPDDPRSTRRWRTLLGLLVLLALLDTGGYVFFNVGVGHASAAIVAAASAPYAVVPIIMGVSLFKERPTGAQWVGVACVIAGVIVLGAFT
ncbi:MAG TPA: EamA family transporter [Solirubrobacteraceae bacterium]